MSRSPALAGWLAAQAISLTGTRISMVALPWFVLTTTGSATKAGLVAFAEMAPYVLAKGLGGPLVDRWGGRRVSVIADLGSVAAVGAIPTLHSVGLLSWPILLGMVAVTGTVRGPSDAAKQALIPSLAAHTDWAMERVTGLAGAVERLAGTVGAAVAGLVVVAVGPVQALTLDAASFAVAGALIALTSPAIQVPAGKCPEVDESYRSRLRAGWEFLRGDRVLVAITVMVAITNLLDQAYFVVLVPVWALESGGPTAMGTLFATFSGCALLGSVAATAFAERLPRRAIYLVAFLLVGAPRFGVLALNPSLPVVLAVSAVGGCAAGFINPILSAVIFERIPTPLVGRVTALTTSMCWVLIPFGGLAAGAAVSAIGLTPTLIVFGASYLLVTTLPARLPQWREIDRRPTPAVASVGTNQAGQEAST